MLSAWQTKDAGMARCFGRAGLSAYAVVYITIKVTTVAGNLCVGCRSVGRGIEVSNSAESLKLIAHWVELWQVAATAETQRDISAQADLSQRKEGKVGLLRSE